MYRFSKVSLIYLLCSPYSRTPVEPVKTRLIALTLLSATERTVSTSTYQIYEADLFHAFTNGSHNPLPTLKPSVTISASRLDTSCWLNFARLAFVSNYILRTELSHSLSTVSRFTCLTLFIICFSPFLTFIFFIVYFLLFLVNYFCFYNSLPKHLLYTSLSY